MDTDDADLSSLGFTSFGKKPDSHNSLPMHSSHSPVSSSLPPKPPSSQFPPQSNQPFQHNNKYGYNNSRGRGRGGPNRSRGPHSNFRGGRGGGGGRGGRGGRQHHHPYAHPGGGQDQPQHQRKDFGTGGGSSQPPYLSKDFGEGLYKPSMDENPWKSFGGASNPGGQGAAAPVADVWMGENAPTEKSNMDDKEEVVVADGGGLNADEIDLGDDI